MCGNDMIPKCVQLDWDSYHPQDLSFQDDHFLDPESSSWEVSLAGGGKEG